MTNFSAWFLASRPKTLTAALAPVAVGTAVARAEGSMALAPAAAALLSAIAIQIGTNFANDAYDFKKGADTKARLGPQRAVQAGLLSARQVLIGAWLAFFVAAIFGVYLIAEGGPWILVIGVVSILSGLAYTAGPWPLAYLGLGDVFVMLFFGFVAVAGTAFVQTGALSTLAIWTGLPIGALSTAILVVNNIRDRVQDTQANKRTLIVRFGRRFGELEYLALVIAAYATPMMLYFWGISGPSILLPLVSAPLAARAVHRTWTLEGAALNPVLAETARLLLVFGVLLAVGL